MIEILNKFYFLLDKSNKNKLIFLLFILVILLILELISIALIIPIISILIDNSISDVFIEYIKLNFDKEIPINMLLKIFIFLFISGILLKNIFFLFVRWHQIKYVRNFRLFFTKKLFNIYLN